MPFIKQTHTFANKKEPTHSVNECVRRINVKGTFSAGKHVCISINKQANEEQAIVTLAVAQSFYINDIWNTSSELKDKQMILMP